MKRRSPPERLFHFFVVKSTVTELQPEELGGGPPVAVAAVDRLFQNAQSAGRVEGVLQCGAYRERAIAHAVARPAARRPQPRRPRGRAIQPAWRPLPWP